MNGNRENMNWFKGILGFKVLGFQWTHMAIMAMEAAARAEVVILTDKSSSSSSSSAASSSAGVSSTGVPSQAQAATVIPS